MAKYMDDMYGVYGGEARDDAAPALNVVPTPSQAMDTVLMADPWDAWDAVFWPARGEGVRAVKRYRLPSTKAVSSHGTLQVAVGGECQLLLVIWENIITEYNSKRRKRSREDCGWFPSHSSFFMTGDGTLSMVGLWRVRKMEVSDYFLDGGIDGYESVKLLFFGSA